MTLAKQDKPYSRIGWGYVRKTYGKRMLRTMAALRSDIAKTFPELNPDEPMEMDADMYSVNILLKPEGREPIDVSFEIVESHDYEGVDGGYTFRMDIVEMGGRMVGGFSPFNYTEQVWCKTKPAIRERFDLVNDVIKDSVGDIARLVEESAR